MFLILHDSANNNYVFIGTNVKVHIGNLREAEEKMKIRPINDEHVEELANSMIHSFDQYTTLVGLVNVNCDVNKLDQPGTGTVQVLGGNHTRAALEIIHEMDVLRTEAKYKFVKMDLYRNLTNEQALFIAFRHNDIHEHSRAMTFQEKVTFFHKLWDKKNNEMKNKPMKVRTTAWRSDVALHTNKTVSQMKFYIFHSKMNLYCLYLHFYFMPKLVLSNKYLRYMFFQSVGSSIIM